MIVLLTYIMLQTQHVNLMMAILYMIKRKIESCTQTQLLLYLLYIILVHVLTYMDDINGAMFSCYTEH